MTRRVAGIVRIGILLACTALFGFSGYGEPGLNEVEQVSVSSGTRVGQQAILAVYTVYPDGHSALSSSASLTGEANAKALDYLQRRASLLSIYARLMNEQGVHPGGLLNRAFASRVHARLFGAEWDGVRFAPSGTTNLQFVRNVLLSSDYNARTLRSMTPASYYFQYNSTNVARLGICLGGASDDFATGIAECTSQGFDNIELRAKSYTATSSFDATLLASRSVELVGERLTESDLPCSNPEMNGRCPVILVAAEFREQTKPIIKMRYGLIDHLVIDGNKANRPLPPTCGPFSKEPVCGRESLVTFSWKNAAGGLTNSVLRNQVVGTAFWVGYYDSVGDSGRPMQVYVAKNLFASSGDHMQVSRWSDGMTAWDLFNSTIEWNQFVDNTDVQLIIGGCRVRCDILNNTFSHTRGFESGSAFADFALAPFTSYEHMKVSRDDGITFASTPSEIRQQMFSSGLYENVTVSDNRFTAGWLGGSGYAMHVGSRPYYPATTSYSNITIVGNWFDEVLAGLVIDTGISVNLGPNGFGNATGGFVPTATPDPRMQGDPCDADFRAGEGELLPGGAIVTHVPRGCTPLVWTDLNVYRATYKTNALYRMVLGRAPDEGGLRYWRTVIPGQGANGVRDAFLWSQEYQNNFMSLTPDEFVESLYRNILGRQSDPNGKAFWVSRVHEYGNDPNRYRWTFYDFWQTPGEAAARVEYLNP